MDVAAWKSWGVNTIVKEMGQSSWCVCARCEEIDSRAMKWNEKKICWYIIRICAIHFANANLQQRKLYKWFMNYFPPSIWNALFGRLSVHTSSLLMNVSRYFKSSCRRTIDLILDRVGNCFFFFIFCELVADSLSEVFIFSMFLPQ